MDYKSLDRRGLFPGPEEGEEEFAERVCTSKRQTESYDERCLDRLEALFAIRPDFAKIEYGNQGLSLWEGGATFIEKGGVRIRLKEGFRKGVYLGLYRREEVLAHELVHLCRMAYAEPRFEEAFAYLSAKSRFRRLFGPLFRRPFESSLFVALAFLPLAALALQRPGWLALAWALPLGMLSFFALRLSFTHHTLAKCLKNVRSLVKNPLALALRLTDEEIARFARTPPDQIRAFIEKEPTFRWHFLRAVYRIDFDI